MQTWNGITPDSPPQYGALDLLRAIVRGALLAVVTFGCLGILLLLRLVEAPLHGQARPWTPHITMFVCRSAFRILGMRHRIHGTPLGPDCGAVVANHSSWLDIFALNACQPVYFVAKSEIARWPGIGWLARATGTIFIKRESRDAARQREVFVARLKAKHLLLFFPEGTSTDGLHVLPFHSSLFAAFFLPEVQQSTQIQPVTVVYRAPHGASRRFYGWWGEMNFASHLLKVLAAPRQGSVDIYYHAPVLISDFADRKSLAAHCHTVVRDRAIAHTAAS